MNRTIEQQNIITSFLGMNIGEALQIGAFAGSGKTTLLCELIKEIEKDHLISTLVCAFSSEIKKELERRIKGCVIKTNHGIGFAAVTQHYYRQNQSRWSGVVDANKYRRLADIWFENHVGSVELKDQLPKLIDMVRVCHVDWLNQEEVEFLCVERDIEIEDMPSAMQALKDILNWGINGLPSPDKFGNTYHWHYCIDFGDQLWLPYILNMNLQKYMYVLVDECQDLSIAQLWLVRNSIDPDLGKSIFVGDKYQAIFAFAGADGQSFGNIQRVMNAKVLPLSICWRCPVAVIREAQKIVPDIQAAPTAEEGLVGSINEAEFDTAVSNRDMVLCRTTAPLISKAFQFIRSGRPVKVKGRDIGNSLKVVIKKIAGMRDFEFTEFPVFLSKSRNREDGILRGKQASDNVILALHDKCDSLEAVYENVILNGGTSVAEMMEEIDKLFSDFPGAYIMFSTIHRAKGLEAPNVFILCPELMPHPMAKTAQAREQEINLRYVAVTRAEKALYYVKTTPKGTATK